MFFIDTNVFFYAHDASDQRKSEIARKLLIQLMHEKRGYISTQVIQEFCNVALKKSTTPLSPDDVARVINDLLRPFLAHQPNVEFYLKTLKVYERYSLSFYDAAIVQSAIDLNCEAIYSEDMQAGAQYGRVLIINPFV